MKEAFLALSCAVICGCATYADKNPSTPQQAEEIIWISSARGNKEVLICSPRLQNIEEDRIIVRLRCQDEEVLSLRSYESIYSDRASALESVRIHWRDDGKAVVINLLVNGGTQETRPYYIVWDGCSAKEVSYEPIWRDNHVGESNVYFERWDRSGRPILKVE
jgi:hypothetical protein